MFCKHKASVREHGLRYREAKCNVAKVSRRLDLDKITTDPAKSAVSLQLWDCEGNDR